MSADADAEDNFDGQERRREERVPARLGVRFEDPTQAARAIKAFSINLSAGGLCIRTKRAYVVGDPLALTLELEGREMKLSGTVAWVREGVVGVRFVNVSPDLQADLLKLLSGLKAET